MSIDLVIHTDRLTKYYGKQLGIENVNLDVRQGEVFGYLGPNGAGKTTTIRTLLDFIRATRGFASLFGLDCRQESVNIRKRIGYLSGVLELYGNLNGEQLLRYVANLRGGVDWNYTQSLAKRLECDLSRRIKTLSHGNKQKIGLIQAFMNKPDLLILDEPTTGLDPLMQHAFYELIDEVKKDGRTIFISSHILPEVEKVCDSVGIIRQGKLIAVETIEKLKSRSLRRIEIQFGQPVVKESFSNVHGVRDIQIQDNNLSCIVIGSLDTLVKAAAKYEVNNITSHEPTLEDIFFAYYHEGNNNA